MTRLDKRIKYKFDTGRYPTNNYYAGEITYRYMIWLGDNMNLRNQYHRETGKYVKLLDDDLDNNYLAWLEQKSIN